MRASETERALACSASLSLPRYENRSEKAEKAAGFGTLAHYWKETGRLDLPGASERDIGVMERKLAASMVRREDWWGDGWRHEVTFAANLKSKELRVHRGPRDNANLWKAQFPPLLWLTGTIDAYKPGDDTYAALVDDLKTGRWLADVTSSTQLKSYAVLPWLEDGAPINWACGVSFTHWEKYPLDGHPKRYRHTVDGMDMAEHWEALGYAAAHPEEVTVRDTVCGHCGEEGHTSFKCENDGVEDAEESLSPCTFCPCREEHPASGWMQNYRYSRMPLCTPGVLKTIGRKT